jgi:hypothetical protein
MTDGKTANTDGELENDLRVRLGVFLAEKESGKIKLYQSSLYPFEWLQKFPPVMIALWFSQAISLTEATIINNKQLFEKHKDNLPRDFAIYFQIHNIQLEEYLEQLKKNKLISENWKPLTSEQIIECSILEEGKVVTPNIILEDGREVEFSVANLEL